MDYNWVSKVIYIPKGYNWEVSLIVSLLLLFLSVVIFTYHEVLVIFGHKKHAIILQPDIFSTCYGTANLLSSISFTLNINFLS